jgi:hypothetical protein
MCVVQQRPEPRERGRRDSAETRVRSGADPRFSACFFRDPPRAEARTRLRLRSRGWDELHLNSAELPPHSFILHISRSFLASFRVSRLVVSPLL